MIAHRLLAAAAAAAILAFGYSAEADLPWSAVALYTAAVYFGSGWQLPPLPRGVQAVLRLVAVAAAAGAALVTVLARQVPIIPEAPGREWAVILGFALTGLVTIGLFTRRSLGRPRFLVLTTVALLVTAGLGYSRPGFLAAGPRVPLDFLLPAAAAALALWAWAVVSGGPRPSAHGLAFFFGAGAALAAAFVVLLPIAQPHVERAVASALAGDATGLGEGTSLGDVASLAESDRVVLRVWTQRPRLLRAFVLDRFDGRAWNASAGGSRALSPLDPGPSPPLLREAAGRFFVLPPFGAADLAATDLVETRIVPAVREGWPLLVPASPIVLRAPVPWLERSAAGVLRVGEMPPLYGVASRPGASTGARPGPGALQLPPRVDPRLRALAAALADGATSDRERLERTVAHLRGGSYRYTLDVGAFRTADPLAEFLFEKRAAYCEYFATAAAVLLRLQGVPTRFVKGFAVGGWNEAAGHYVVRDRDAHAWVEAWLPGEGWVERDPTPPRDFAALHPRRPLASLAEWLEGARAAAAKAWALVAAGEWRQVVSQALAAVARSAERGLTAPAAAAALALAAGLAAIRLWRGRRAKTSAPAESNRPAVPPELRELLRRLDRRWAQAGAARPPARALVEHLDRLPASGLSPAAVETSRRVVEAYYEAAFAGRPPDAATLARLALRLGSDLES